MELSISKYMILRYEPKVNRDYSYNIIIFIHNIIPRVSDPKYSNRELNYKRYKPTIAYSKINF